MERIRTRNYINSARIQLAILGSIYFSSILWFIIINEQSKKVQGEEEDQVNFVNYFKLDEMKPFERQIALLYYSFTTLSQVGFGDFYPVNNEERIMCAIYMFLGVTIYSFIGNNFAKMIENLKNFEKDFEESSKLQQFFQVMRNFNFYSRLPRKIEVEIIEFFKYKWEIDQYR